MRMPPIIVLVPWLLSLVLEIWLVFLVCKRKFYRDLPVFSSMVIIYAVLDLTVLCSSVTRFYPYPLFTLREIASVVLRTWLLFDLCRRLLVERPWTKALLMLILVGSAVFLIGVGFPVFLSEHTAGTATTYLHLGVWFRTVYFAQVGVIAILLLMNIGSMLAAYTREIGMAIGLATTSAAELVSMTLRNRPNGGTDYAMISLNYIGMVTAAAIWIMFLLPRNSMDASNMNERRALADAAYSATNASD
jgi:hypothetical protein